MLRTWVLATILISIVASIVASPRCGAQVRGSFSLEKTVYAVGEPVMLSLTLTNDGPQPIELATADPYAFCSGYQVHVERLGEPDVTCSAGSSGGSCLSGTTTPGPHGTRTERILLNFENDSRGASNLPVRLPGRYTVDARRAVGLSPYLLSATVSAPGYEVHQTLTLRVDEALLTLRSACLRA